MTQVDRAVHGRVFIQVVSFNESNMTTLCKKDRNQCLKRNVVSMDITVTCTVQRKSVSLERNWSPINKSIACNYILLLRQGAGFAALSIFIITVDR